MGARDANIARVIATANGHELDAVTALQALANPSID
jgi:hypothetical protein